MDPFSTQFLPIPVPVPNGKFVPASFAPFYSLINYLPATNFSKFLRDFPMKISGIPESEAEIPIPDPPARGAIPAEFTTKQGCSRVVLGEPKI